MNSRKNVFLVALILIAIFTANVLAEELTTPLTTPFPSNTPTTNPSTTPTTSPTTTPSPSATPTPSTSPTPSPQPTTGTDNRRIDGPFVTITPSTMPPANQACDWTCQLIPIGTPSIQITAKDEWGTPVSAKDTTAYMCSIKTSSASCTKEKLDKACKPISDPSSTVRVSTVVEATGKFSALVTVVSSYKCGDKITLGPPIQKLFQDCGAAKREWDAAKKEREKACDSAKVKEKEAKCTSQKNAVEKAKTNLEETKKTIDWEKSVLTSEKRKLEEMRGRLPQLQTELEGLKADVEKKKIIWLEAEKDVQNYRTGSTGAWAEGLVGTAGPVGTIYSVLTLLGGDWGQLLGFIPYVGDYINAGQAGMSVEEAEAKVKAAEQVAARAQDAYQSAVSYMKATGVEQLIQDYETRLIPQTEATIIETEKKLTDLDATLKAQTDELSKAQAEYEKCAGTECENAKKNEKDAQDKYQACITS